MVRQRVTATTLSLLAILPAALDLPARKSIDLTGRDQGSRRGHAHPGVRRVRQLRARVRFHGRGAGRNSTCRAESRSLRDGTTVVEDLGHRAYRLLDVSGEWRTPWGRSMW